MAVPSVVIHCVTVPQHLLLSPKTREYRLIMYNDEHVFKQCAHFLGGLDQWLCMTEFANSFTKRAHCSSNGTWN